VIAGRGSLGFRKHRQARVHKRVPVSDTTKRAVLKTLSDLRPPHLTTTEWFSTVAEALAPPRKKTIRR